MKRVFAVALSAGLLAALAGCSEDPGYWPPDRPDMSQSPETQKAADERGRIKVQPWAAVDANDTVHWIAGLVNGYEAPDVKKPPAKFEDVRMSAHCAVRRAQREAKVVFISNDDSKFSTPMYHVVAKNARLVHDGALNLWDMGLVDVVVTETTQPVHLILHSEGDILYNLHLGDGVRIDGITLLGAQAMAVANVPDGVKVAAVSERHPKTKGCALGIAREETGGDGFRPNVERWLTKNVGKVNAIIGHYNLSHVLVGPAPQSLEARVKFSPLAGSTVHVSGGEVVFWDTSGSFVKKAKTVGPTMMDGTGRMLIMPTG